MNKTSGRLLETAERRTFVLDLRKSGASYPKIAEAALKRFGAERLPNGWDERYAYKDVKRELDRLNEERTEGAEEVRRLELERLDRMLMGLWTQAIKGQQGAIDRVLKIMKRRANLLGIDAPKRTELTGKDGGPIEIDDAREAIQRKLNSIRTNREAAELPSESDE